MATTPHNKGEGSPLANDLEAQYLAALIDIDRPAASAIVERALTSHLDTATILLDIFGLALRELGDRWSNGDVTVAQEHWGTQATTEELGRVVQRRRPTQLVGRRVVVASVPGEVHTMPARIVASLFAAQGWAVDFLGEAPPVKDLFDFVSRRSPNLVALSMILSANEGSCADTCRQLRALDPAPVILVGGPGAADSTARSLGADAVVLQALEGINRANELVGIGGRRDPAAYLAMVGQRILQHRRSNQMSQSELAKRAGLTRPYLSAIERGRQNITLESALKIAGALEVSMARILDDAESIVESDQ